MIQTDYVLPDGNTHYSGSSIIPPTPLKIKSIMIKVLDQTFFIIIIS